MKNQTHCVFNSIILHYTFIKRGTIFISLKESDQCQSQFEKVFF